MGHFHLGFEDLENPRILRHGMKQANQKAIVAYDDDTLATNCRLRPHHQLVTLAVTGAKHIR